MEAAGYDVTIQPFDLPVLRGAGTGRTRADSHQSRRCIRISTRPGSPRWTTRAAVTSRLRRRVSISCCHRSADPNTSTSGCEASDFAGFTAGNIAIIQRGTCSFALKAQNAEAAGAVGVVIFNEGQPGRTVAFLGTLGGPGATIPVVGASIRCGCGARCRSAVEVRMFVDATSEIRTTSQRARRASRPKRRQRRDGRRSPRLGCAKVRGSRTTAPAAPPSSRSPCRWPRSSHATRCVSPGGAPRNRAGRLDLLRRTACTEDELDDIALYLNFDMIGSPNFVYFIYDGDDSDGVGAGPGPEGSAQIEEFFESFYEARDLPFMGTDFSGRSDYGPFIAVGIPAGGLFTGAEGIKTIGRGRDLGRHRRRAVRPVLPPGLRHVRQHQPRGARRQLRRRRRIGAARSR